MKYSKESIDKFLRDEAEAIGNQIDNLEIKMTGIINKYGITKIDKLQELSQKREMLKAQQFKLYEMMGRLPNIEETIQ